MQVSFGSGYNRNAVRLILAEISNEHGQQAVDRLIRELGLTEKFGLVEVPAKLAALEADLLTGQGSGDENSLAVERGYASAVMGARPDTRCLGLAATTSSHYSGQAARNWLRCGRSMLTRVSRTSCNSRSRSLASRLPRM